MATSRHTPTWRTKQMQELFRAISSLEGEDEVEHFLRDLCTLGELEAMAHRWEVARLLEEGLPYLEVARVDVLFVGAADIPEYVQDGVVDCGITGIALVRERGARVDELLRLGFGACRLEAAVPTESPVQSVEELAGLTVATVYPRLAR